MVWDWRTNGVGTLPVFIMANIMIISLIVFIFFMINNMVILYYILWKIID